MRLSIPGLGLLLMLLPGATVQAVENGLARAEALYEKGDLAQAAALARKAGGAEGFSLAAKATLVEAVWRTPEDEQGELLKQAVEDAEAALAIDPTFVDAHLQLAIAFGQQGDLQDPVSAHVMGYANAGKAHLDKALELAPDDAWAHALTGIWHLQLVRRASAGLAEEFYGASEQEGVAACREALELAPGEPNLGFGCALSLLQVDGEGYRGDALAMLEAIERQEPRDAAERLVQAEAARVIERLKAEEPPS